VISFSNKYKTLSKQSSILCFLIFLCLNVSATNYYVKNGGNDEADGLSDATAWGTTEKINGIQHLLNPGDSILFKRGDTIYGKITAGKSGIPGKPVVYGAYGQGTDPVISGFTAITSWSDEGEGIFSKVVSCESPTNMVTINGVNTPMARWPKSEYLSIDSYVKNTSITDAELPSLPDWTGAEVVIRKNSWVIDRNLITDHTNHTLTYKSGSSYNAGAGYGYFIQNDLRLLTDPGEWYYDKVTSTFYMFFGGMDPADYEVKISSLDYNFNSQSHDNIVLENLYFTGSNIQGIYLPRSSSPVLNPTTNVTIRNCSVMYGGGIGIDGPNAEYILIDNCYIQYMNSNGITLTPGGISNTVKDCTISDIATIIGMGNSGDGTYVGLRNVGHNALIQNNIVKKIGYLGIEYRGSNSIVENNLVDSFLLVKRDGAGIYTYYNNTRPAKDPNTGRIVRNNIVLNGFGMGAGTPTGENSANGYYVDGFSSGVTVTGNTAGYLTGAAFHGNFEADNIFSYNTIFEVRTFFSIQTWVNINPEVINNVFIHNIFVSPKNGQKIGIRIRINQSTYDLQEFAQKIKDIGRIDSNYYYSNLECFVWLDQTTTGSRLVNNPYNLERWTDFSGHDIHSVYIPTIKDYKIVSTGENMITNSAFDTNITGWYASNAENASVSRDEDEMGNGSLKIENKVPSFTLTGSSRIYTVIPGTVNNDKSYLVRLTSKSAQNNKTIGVLLEPSGTYDYSNTNLFSVNNNMTDHEILIRNPKQNAKYLNIYPGDDPVNIWFDDIGVYESVVEDVDVYDHFLFAYNPTDSDSVISLAAPMTDLKGNKYISTITIPPWGSVILISEPSVISGNEDFSRPGKGIKDEATAGDMIIIPNPASGQLWIKVEDTDEERFNYCITDMQGKIRIKGQLENTGNGNYPVNISDLASGIYLVRVAGMNGRGYYKKIVICSV